MGQLLGPARLTAFVQEVLTYFEASMVANYANATWCTAHVVRCALVKEVMRLGLSAAFELSYKRTAPYIKPYVMQEIRGLADATGGKLSVGSLRNVMWIGELTRGACSMFGASGSATADGSLLQLRALDWDVTGPFKNHAVLVVYHPNLGDGHAWLNLGFAGFTMSVTGVSSERLALSEIGVSYPDASFGPESYLARGYPFGFLLRDVLQFDPTLDAATQRIQNATRTCDLILGVGDGKDNAFRGYQYSPHVARVITPTTLQPVNDSWHPQIDDVVYWGMDWICPNDNRMLSTALRRLHGHLTAEATLRDVTSYVNTGDLHIAIYDHPNAQMYFATARPDGSSGPLNAYQRQFTKLDVAALWAEQKPTAAEVEEL